MLHCIIIKGDRAVCSRCGANTILSNRSYLAKRVCGVETRGRPQQGGGYEANRILQRWGVRRCQAAEFRANVRAWQ